jgi:error-prone DNA polymerase
VQARSAGPFGSIDEFARRTGLSSAVLQKLSKADAFASLAINRREALWQSLPAQKTLPLFDPPPLPLSPQRENNRGTDLKSVLQCSSDEPSVALPPMSPLAEVTADYRAAGLSLRDHPLKFVRPQLEKLRAVPASQLAVLPDGRRVKVAGLVLLRQRPGTAGGITFVTLEDETGFANLIVRPDVWERYHHVARTAQAMLVRGLLQRQDTIIHVLADKLEDLSTHLSDMRVPSRDFR